MPSHDLADFIPTRSAMSRCTWVLRSAQCGSGNPVSDAIEGVQQTGGPTERHQVGLSNRLRFDQLVLEYPRTCLRAMGA